MRESTSTSDFSAWLLPRFALALACATLWASGALAADPAGGGGEPPAGGTPKTDKALQPEEDDFAPSPFTEYGEFNSEEEEAADARFFQHGRFFGVSLGTGFEGITGNRGQLWQGGSPIFDLRIHYWFDFNVAMDLGFYTAPHFFESKKSGGHWDATLFFVGLHVKYYFDTKNLSAAISFANPYILAGAGGYTKTQFSASENTSDQESAAGFGFGGGLEFPIRAKKIYFTVEGRMNFATFKDTYYTTYKDQGVPDLTGAFYNMVGALMFTW